VRLFLSLAQSQTVYFNFETEQHDPASKEEHEQEYELRETMRIQ
jgi:hypothetical protein